MTHFVRILAWVAAAGGAWSLLVSCSPPPDYTAGTEPAASCEDGEQNGNETDTDCGGGGCPLCVVGQSCLASIDCALGECTAGLCRSPHCTNGQFDYDELGVDCGGADCPACAQPSCENGVPNEGETDLDCGGVCEPCALGRKCIAARDCESGYCGESGTCRDAHCLNGKKDSSETGEDCGGKDCDPCAAGLRCQLPRDCVDLVCKEDTCQEPTCDDDVQNGDETDTDCGGDCENACPDSADCEAGSDCMSGVCAGNLCQPPTCDDGVRNGDETAQDCGGAQCQAVRTCSVDQPCVDHADCGSGWCEPSEKTCVEPTCTDVFENGDETDVDCGGSCEACEAGFHCESPDDCASSNCVGAVCQAATCKDGIPNQGEGGLDCGGTSSCAKCADGTACTSQSDCGSGVCKHSLCAAAACDDTTLNGLETDIDCGGDTGCHRCTASKKCQADSDCEEGYECPSEVDVCAKPQCANGIQDEDETDQDCGGTCPPCGDDMGCALVTDCQSLVCDEETLTCLSASCEDGVKNGDEPYEDCGGSDPDCARCEVGRPCTKGTDCVSSSCGEEEDNQVKTCREPTCEDGIRNADEVGIDCRGWCPNKCPASEPCTDDEDCESSVCIEFVCQAPRCDDETKNSSETDVDCGGNCDPCDDGLHCEYPSDCRSSVCVGSTCQVPTCEDETRNGGETGQDCGGDCLPKLCPSGQGCAEKTDCETLLSCRDNTCIHIPCEDGVVGEEETDIDCGGTECLACNAGHRCLLGDDCTSASCGLEKLCLAATCLDGIANQGETDADCGGSSGCDPCAAGKACASDDDCLSSVCRDGGSGLVCQAATCSDQTENQGEADVDCGGGVCSRCLAGSFCGEANDCRSGLCPTDECEQSEVEVYFFGSASGVQEYWLNLQIKNVSSASIDLKDYTLRYYFSHEGSGSPEVMDHTSCCSSVTLTQDSGSQWHLNIVPLGTTVAAGSTSSMPKFRLHNNGLTADWTNDYSYGPQSEYTTDPWLTIAAYRGSTLVFGIPGP